MSEYKYLITMVNNETFELKTELNINQLNDEISKKYKEKGTLKVGSKKIFMIANIIKIEEIKKTDTK